MSLEIDLHLARPGFALDVGFSSPGGVTALFGRSGAGKSTLTGLVTGALRPDRGLIRLDGRVLLDTAQHIAVPQYRRRIGTVFQDGRLFPHLTVRRNLLYSSWFRRGAGVGKLDQVLALLGIEHLLQRYPAGLSGGERSRVAIGRALLSEPDLLVLDEPLAALDAARKNEILPYLERLRDEVGLPMIYVSHSLDEVVRLADTLVVLDAGKVAASGPVDEVVSGLDLGPGTGRAEAGAVIPATVAGIDPAYGLARLEFAGGSVTVPAEGLGPGQKLRLHIRARDVAISTAAPDGISILNILPAEIIGLLELDQSVELQLAVGPTRLVARITRLSAESLGLAPGQRVHALIKSVAFDRRLA
ncbi:MAG TPA: molybdenum ABC transporter ATP-binding protein [Aliidongia sp.]|nr:molybdenum ABC transporter ATP-binding protein [Aliidongia sp.]